MVKARAKVTKVTNQEPKITAAQKNKRVTFKFSAAQPFNQVKLAGNFSDWEQGAIVMTKNKSGEWRAQLSLPAGEYEYKFLADGVWFNDPGADKQVPNIWGNENSLRIVR